MVGMQKRGINTNTFYRYDSQGVFQDIVFVTADRLNARWLGRPNITLNPPYKETVITTKAVEGVNMLPEDAGNQEWTYTRNGTIAPPVKYWKSNNTSAIPLKLYNREDEDLPTYGGEPISVPGYPGFQSINSLTDPGVFSYYMSLIRRPYVKKTDAPLKVKVRFGSKHYNPSEVAQVFPDGDFNSQLMYDIQIDGVTVLGNRSDFNGRGAYLFEWNEQIKNGNSFITAELDIDIAKISLNGFLDFRMYNMAQAALVGDDGDHAWIESISIVYGSESVVEYSRRRNLNRSNIYDDELHFGDSVHDQVLNSVIYQNTIDPSEFTEVAFSVLGEYDTGTQNLGYTLVTDSAGMSLLTASSTSVYVQREGSDFYQFVDDLYLHGVANLFKINLV